MHYPEEISILLKECVKNTDKYADLKLDNWMTLVEMIN